MLFLLMCLSVAYATNTSEDDSGQNYERFMEVPVDDNKTMIIDLEAKPNLDLLNFARGRNFDSNTYTLYTRNNPIIAQNLAIYESSSIKASNFDPSSPTFVLIHGWQGHPNRAFDRKIKNALLDKKEANIIVVDWHIIAALDYATAVLSVPLVGRSVGRLLRFLNTEFEVPFSSMHIIGHSLGAHVAGNAGRELCGKAARVTGLDPAGPLWYLNPERLNNKDAVYVEAIHTNGLGFGIEEVVGDADFYPNRGTFQPGCLTITCNHARSYELFAASITFNKFTARKCQNFMTMLTDSCNGESVLMGNDDINKRGLDKVYLWYSRVHKYIGKANDR